MECHFSAVLDTLLLCPSSFENILGKTGHLPLTMNGEFESKCGPKSRAENGGCTRWPLLDILAVHWDEEGPHFMLFCISHSASQEVPRYMLTN